MKQSQFNESYRALVEFSKMELPIRDSLKVATLMKKLRPAIEAETEMEQTIIQKHHAKVDKEGNLVVAVEDMKEADRLVAQGRLYNDWLDLMNAEVEFEFEPIVIPVDDIADQRVSAEFIAKLEGFVLFD